MALGGKPYTLDDDQARAVFDNHKNTLVTARAGSGKTRVIVAKIAYLVATRQARLSEIAAFMFNRTAAAEVNERIGAVEIDGVSLSELNGGKEIKVASTFHKFALDVAKLSGEQPVLISETEHDALVKQAVRKVVSELQRKVPAAEYVEILRLANSFIARAGQKYTGESGLSELCETVAHYAAAHQDDADYAQKIFLHQICLAAYQEYLLNLHYPRLDFNILMARATRILKQQAQHTSSTMPDGSDSRAQKARSQELLTKKVQRYKYLMVDEYQDFSYLFLSLIRVLRMNCPAAHLFAVGDDWQAINRFAGSDVDYFLNFATYFPEDVTNIPLSTNYRSARRIVENANRYMLANYDPQAKKAIPFSKKSGKIIRINPNKTRFDPTDLDEDGLGDARYQLALAEVCSNASRAVPGVVLVSSNRTGAALASGGRASSISKTNRKLQQNPQNFTAAAQLLKTVVKIIKRHRKAEILLLHRHNFTSCLGVTLGVFLRALEKILIERRIMTAQDFAKRVRGMTMHKSKGLESEIVILLEVDKEIVVSCHPHATIFELFGDNLAAERADQQRLLYVAMTRAKERLYILSRDKQCIV